MLVPRRRRDRLIVTVALVAYLVIGFFPYLVSGLLVPPGAVAVLMACWAGGLVFTARSVKRRPLLAPAAVVVALLFWFVFVTAGSALFGWTA